MIGDRRRHVSPKGDVEMAGPSRIGVIGDVHACDDRLAALLRFFESRDLDCIVCVGDVVTGPGSPDRCVELLADADVLTVRGNHDRWLLDGTPPVGLHGHRLGELAPSTVDFLRSLPPSVRLNAAYDTRILLCHGLGDNDMNQISADDFGYALEANRELQELLAERAPLVVVKGHRHRSAVWSIGALLLLDAGTLADPVNAVGAIIDLPEKTILEITMNSSFMVSEGQLHRL
jgi:predicted phosphodiesterase